MNMLNKGNILNKIKNYFSKFPEVEEPLSEGQEKEVVK